MSDPVRTSPGEIGGWPKLVMTYPTRPESIDALLPPGIDRCGEPLVHIGIYCVPVHGEPEFGVSTKVSARFDDLEGRYSLGMGIDQESAIFISRETNGQPKFPCEISFFRLGDTVEASCHHQGCTFLSYSGSVSGMEVPTGVESSEDEWWIKVSRAVGGDEGAYDLPPRVVRVHTEGVVTQIETLDGRLTLRESRWDPYTELLPMVGPASAALVTTRHTARSITVAGSLDPDGFWPFADTIGGSRWPGDRGGPRRTRTGAEETS